VAEQVRNSRILWEMMHVLRDAAKPLSGGQVIAAVRVRFEPTEYESAQVKTGGVRWEIGLQFKSGEAATVGWMTKRGGWALVEAGLDALEEFPAPDLLYAELSRRSRDVDQQRKQAMQTLNEVDQFISRAIEVVEAGQWTAHSDLASLADTSAGAVAHFLASFKIRIPNAYRVLNADGSIPDEGMVHANFRGVDLQLRLAQEGLEFDEQGRAGQHQRLSAEALRELLETRSQIGGENLQTARRAWMVRGTNVDGNNVVPEWLTEEIVTLSAAQLVDVDPMISYEDLKQAVEVAYQHKSYAYRGQRLEELDRFIRQMQPGDLVLTPMQGDVFLGEISSGARFSAEAGISGELYRKVSWRNRSSPVDLSELRAPVPALLQSQSTVVDLTEAYDQLAALLPGKPGALPPIVEEHPVLSLRPVSTEIAADLLMKQAELQKIADLLWERRQVIFYGPPGTGKTYLAKSLARYLTRDGAVRLVQFHPSYAYEDFFEGFRPKQADGGSGALTFELTPGPFRLFAETAKANPATAYILIIDEINRANLAKVFGELYFLLEYRDESISLQYSPKEEFTLPENMFLIGTMNTADRSIARIDTAMRRRFAFIELDPRIPPVQGLLARWLEDNDLPDEPARLLDLLNARLGDADLAIGPSYLMKKAIYDRPDGIDRVWQYEIMPLLEDLFYGQSDLAERYGLGSLRAAIGTDKPVSA
jgi:5-methylcytosine-specific restriction enzyme B